MIQTPGKTFHIHLSPAWKWAGAVWLCSQVILTLLGLTLWNSGLIPPTNEHYYSVQPARSALIGAWQRWDTLHYQRIVDGGYASSEELSAFFPLYPLLAKGLAAVFGMDSLPALLIVSRLAFLVALFAGYRIFEQASNETAAKIATASMALLPTSFFFLAGYPQALVLALTLLAYWFARHQRWLLAAGVGLLAGLSHSTVLPLSLMLGWEALEWVRAQKTWRSSMALLSAAAPLMGVALFLAWRMQQGFPPFAALMTAVWNRVVQWPWETMADLLPQFRSGPVYGSLYTDLLLLALMTACLVWGWKNLRRSAWIYQAALLLYLLTTTVQGQPLTSFGRYALVGFPVYLFVARLADRKRARLALFATGLALQLFLCGIFFAWGWVD